MESKHSRDYKYSAVHGDEPGDVRLNNQAAAATNRQRQPTLLKVAMGSTLIAAAVFLAIGYV